VKLSFPQARPGDCFKVKALASSYQLPAGLNDGDEVKCISFDHGYWEVERDGQIFNIFMGCLDIEPLPSPPVRKSKR